ncbi:MAG: glycosyltransferase family 2 protein [Actinomycetota bacterium]|nr:glycosyltransferase family 2 protein [Actinomycetota bacterium]
MRPIAVVVVLFNSAPLLPDLIESLGPGLAGTDWRLILVDNASTDDSVEVARRLAPSAKILETGRNGGYSAGINIGVGAAGEFSAVLILNADVRLGPGSIVHLLQGLDTPGTGIAIPRLTDGDGRLLHSMRREPTLLRAAADAVIGAERAGRIGRLGEIVADPAQYEFETTTDWGEGSTQLISAACWRRCGGWDESFFLYSEEAEYGLRARSAGLATRFVPSAHATHLTGGSATSPASWALLSANKVRLYTRRRGHLRGAAFYLAVLVREVSRAALGKSTSRAAVRELVTMPLRNEKPGPHTLARHQDTKT